MRYVEPDYDVEATKEFVSNDEEDADASNDEDQESDDGSSVTGTAVDLTEGYFGVGKAQRAWSQKLGTDPYSSNEVLQAAIKEVAWAEPLGKFGMGFAGVPSIPGADIIGEVNNAVWSLDPWAPTGPGRCTARSASPTSARPSRCATGAGSQASTRSAP